MVIGTENLNNRNMTNLPLVKQNHHTGIFLEVIAGAVQSTIFSKLHIEQPSIVRHQAVNLTRRKSK